MTAIPTMPPQGAAFQLSKASLASLVCLGLLAANVQAAPVQFEKAALSVAGEPSLTLPSDKRSAPGDRFRSAELALSSARLSFAGVSAAEWAALDKNNATNRKRQQIGIGRGPELASAPFPSSTRLAWATLPDGSSAARITLHADSAQALRAGLAFSQVPAGFELRVQGASQQVERDGVVTSEQLSKAPTHWTAMTEGDTQTIEFWLPAGVAASALRYEFLGVSHVLTSPKQRLQLAPKKTTAFDIGESGSCNVDLSCVNLSAALKNVARATAKMSFIDGTASYVCTGTLLNDTDARTQVPFFASGNHCFDNVVLDSSGRPNGQANKSFAEMQRVADTLNTFWFFEAVACNSFNVPDFTQLRRGATLLFRDDGFDAMLLQLSDSAPANSYFAGWDASAFNRGDDVFTIHHPGGDLKKISQGSTTAYVPVTIETSLRRESFAEVLWKTGVTETGSSGAGLFTLSNTSNEYQWRGSLWGGASSCKAPSEPDYYTRFDGYAQSFAVSLAPGTARVNYTDLWYTVGQGGWGLNLTHHSTGASNQMFGVWYTYRIDGKPQWYTVPGGRWVNDQLFVGNVYKTIGPSAAAPLFRSSVVRLAGSAADGSAGVMQLRFSDSNTAVMEYTIDGVTDRKNIVRLPF